MSGRSRRCSIQLLPTFLLYHLFWLVNNRGLIPNADFLFYDDVIEAALAGSALHAEHMAFAIEPLDDGRAFAVVVADHLVFVHARALRKRDAAVADEKFPDMHESSGRNEITHAFILSRFLPMINGMDFDACIQILNALLTEKKPEAFNSSWILKHAPQCYRFFHKNVRAEIGGIDWDRVTYAIEWKFQRRWAPGRKKKNPVPYENSTEVELIMNKYREKIYVFVAPADVNDRRIRDIISISLVRLAQNGNLSAKEELMKLLGYTIGDWMERFRFLSRWQGYDDQIRENLERCIRRYRYTGSFAMYLFRTLEYAGRGIRPFYAYSLDKPVACDAEKRLIDNVIQDAETNEIQLYNRS